MLATSNEHIAITYAALAYYHDNFDRIRQDLTESTQAVERLRQTNPSKLQANALDGDRLSEIFIIFYDN